jgi:hypothetical protein
VRRALQEMIAERESRSRVVRIALDGETSLHTELVAERTALRDEFETLAASLSDDVWIEKVEIGTRKPSRHGFIDPSIAGQLEA